jgi:nitroimidazol reductase NimA-like FMN-containing flavoprotein (pyridoxamine 5'-phosphate oxidase superfamily)
MPEVQRPAMAAYGVPDDLDGALPWSWADTRLSSSRNFWVVTASSDARPHAMPVWGVWLSTLVRFAFSCAPQSRKARNLRTNPQIVVMVDDTVECVSLEGRAREIAGDEVDVFVDAYARKYETEPDKQTALAAFMRENSIFEVTPERAFGIIEREDEFSKCATRWVWR